MNGDMILVLDLGSRENERLVQELGELGVYSEVRPHTFTREELDNMPNVKGVIVNGGPNWEGAEVSRRSAMRPCRCFWWTTWEMRPGPRMRWSGEWSCLLSCSACAALRQRAEYM